MADDLFDDISDAKMRGSVTELAQAMIRLLMEHRAPNAEGCGALATALIVSLADSGIDREEALRLFAGTWDVIYGPSIEELRRHHA